MTERQLTAWREDDREAWNGFVESARYGAFAQLWEWGELRREHGWRVVRLAVGTERGRPLAGVQLLVRPLPVVRWALAYAPRGPIGELDDPAPREALLAAVRRLARRERIATLRADPEATADEHYGAALLADPWRAAQAIQPTATRLIDLAPGPDELFGAMRRKHRQYVNKAEKAGLTVERLDADAEPELLEAALADFHAILSGTADRSEFNVRPLHVYRRTWELFAPDRRIRLYFAARDGRRLATLMHLTCGDRATELYGGSTPDGARDRANYLVKWGAIRDFAAEGFAAYDLWGMPTGGIAQFKEGFGGRVVEYVGARDLAIRPPADALVRAALGVRAGAVRLRDRWRRR